jgi:hypothetical protein
MEQRVDDEVVYYYDFTLQRPGKRMWRRSLWPMPVWGYKNILPL